MTRAEIQAAADLLCRVAVEHRPMISRAAAGHVESVVALLGALLVVVPEQSACPSDRVGGMCPCELADLAKAAGR